MRRIDVLLSVGQSTQEITVSAGAAIIETESGTIGGLFNNQQHADVPLIDIYPSPSSMLTTVPGVQGGTGSLRMQGQSTNQQSPGFDGLNNDQTGGQSSNTEFFQEVTAITVNAPAASPRVASYTMTTKRGENALHGMVYYKLFSSEFDARNFSLPPELPGRSRWVVRSSRTERSSTEHGFHSAFPLDRLRRPRYRPCRNESAISRRSRRLSRNPLTNQPFPGSLVPASRISSVSAQLQTLYYPLPVVGGLVNNYPFIFPFNSDLFKGDWLLFRLDHTITAKNSIYARWLLRRTPYALQMGLPSIEWTRLRNHQQWAVVDTHLFSPSFVNTFRFGLATDYIVDGTQQAGITPPDGAKVLAATGLQSSNPGNFSGQGFPTMSISGLTTLQNDAGGVISNNYTYILMMFSATGLTTQALGGVMWLGH